MIFHTVIIRIFRESDAFCSRIVTPSGINKTFVSGLLPRPSFRGYPSPSGVSQRMPSQPRCFPLIRVFPGGGWYGAGRHTGFVRAHTSMTNSLQDGSFVPVASNETSHSIHQAHHHINDNSAHDSIFTVTNIPQLIRDYQESCHGTWMYFDR